MLGYIIYNRYVYITSLKYISLPNILVTRIISPQMQLRRTQFCNISDGAVWPPIHSCSLPLVRTMVSWRTINALRSRRTTSGRDDANFNAQWLLRNEFFIGRYFQ